MKQPHLICHCDWSTTANKRWLAKATLGSDGRYTALAPEQVGEPKHLLSTLKAEAGEQRKQRNVFVGFDFPIGLPVHYARRAGVNNFRTFLSNLSEPNWKQFFDVCNSPSDISIHRPFYPNGSSKGCARQHLFEAHKVDSMEPLLRECERGSDGHRQACSLFWTLGGNQVGKAALCGWKDVLIPGLTNEWVGLWPFDGALESLLSDKRVVIAETYPAECYGWFPGKKLQSKSDIESRKGFGSTLLTWAQQNNISVEQNLDRAIRGGFPSGGDDAFDALVGLFGMLEVVLNKRATGEPDHANTRQIEGWILGRNAGTVNIEQASSTSPHWSEWRIFPDPRKCEILVAPLGPGCYDLRNRRTHESILCGIGGHLAERMSSLLPRPHGCGTRNNTRKRGYVLAHLGDVEYRTIATVTKADASEIEFQLLRKGRYLFPT